MAKYDMLVEAIKLQFKQNNYKQCKPLIHDYDALVSQMKAQSQ